MDPSTRTEILNLIATNSTSEAIQRLREVHLNTPLEAEIIHQSARLKEIGDARDKGLITYNEYLLQRNRIQDALIKLASAQPELEEGEPTKEQTFRERVQELVKGQFLILKPLNEGIVAQVYQAYDIQLRRMVAIKAFKTADFMNKDHLYQIDQDISSAGRYKHRNIMTVYQGRLDTDPKFTVLEYVDGMDLRYILKHTGSLSLRESLALIWQIGRALEYGHRRNHVHGRVRPSNVLVDEENQAILTAFQLLKNERTHPDFKKMAENIRYWAPEQFEGKVSEFSDQFSLGLTGFEMIHGEPLFRGESALEIFSERDRFFKDPERFFSERADKKCPESLLAVIRKMLEWDPAQRWQDIRGMTRELEMIDLEPDDLIRIAKNSYKRIRYNREFVEKFYHNFFSHPEAAKTRVLFSDLERQYKMLRQAIHRLLEFGTETESRRKSLDKVAQRHAERGISPDLFPLFMETFIRTASQFDPKWDSSPAIEQAWNRATRRGLDRLIEVSRSLSEKN